MQTWAWYFFAYAFLGWCSEVVFAAVKNGRFVNRGFLSGPLCPIYGFGIVGVLLAVGPLKDNLLWLYLGSVAVTTALELVTGFAMEKLFHQRWWDYSKMPLNIGGYVCLPFSLIWGIACVAIVDGLHPIISRIVALIPSPWGLLTLCLFTALFLLDVVLAIAKAFKLDRRLSQIDELSDALRMVSDKLGETMADGALLLKEADGYARSEWQTASQQARQTLLETNEKAVTELKTRHADLKARHADLLEKFASEQRHNLKAFPHLRSLRHPDALGAVKKKLVNIRKAKDKQ